MVLPNGTSTMLSSYIHMKVSPPHTIRFPTYLFGDSH